MTALRAKYIRDLTVRGRAQRTQRAYTRYVSELARYYQRSPELISYEEVTNWLYHLIKERQLSASSVNVAVNAVRFLYGITLGRNTEVLTTSVPHFKDMDYEQLQRWLSELQRKRRLFEMNPETYYTTIEPPEYRRG